MKISLPFILLFFHFHTIFAELDTEWWKHTIIYELLPFSYKDSDGDGVGDIKGITSKLPHLEEMGIETIHMTPMFKTSMRDMGYDINDYYEIDPTYGTMEDFDELMREMKKRDMKLLLDLVINHSGHKHEWFLKSIEKIEPYTDFYVWKDAKENGTKIPPNNWRNIFDFNTLGSAWTWNEKRQQFYFHQFLPEQPDFNLGNEIVKKELKKLIKFWLDKGVAGFRLDAAPHFFEDKEFRDDSYDLRQKDQPETFEFIHEFRLYLDEYNKEHGGCERIFVAEAHSSFEIAARYYGNESYALTHFPYSFILEYVNEPMNSLYFYWYIFYGSIYQPNGAISAWMIQDHDGWRVGSRVIPEYSDIMTLISLMLPGTVGVYYGQEIGMMNNFVLPHQIRDYSGNGGRDPARLIMQWDDSTSAGFSTNATTFLPSNSDYFQRNVESQKKDKFSSYHMFKELSKLRKTETLKQGSFWQTPSYGDYIYTITRYYKRHTCVLIINLDQSPSSVNVTQIMNNPSNDVSIVTASENAGYEKGLIVDRQSLHNLEIRPLSGLVFETYYSKDEIKVEDD